jgi:hypothetical protein
MLVKPNTAFTGVPSGRFIGGKAWKARKMKPDPSIRMRCSGRASGPAGAVAPPASVLISIAAGSMSAVVIGSRVQDV